MNTSISSRLLAAAFAALPLFSTSVRATDYTAVPAEVSVCGPSQEVYFTGRSLAAVKGLSIDGFQKFGGLSDTHTYTVYEGEASTGAPSSGYYRNSSLFGYANDGSVLTVEFHGVCLYGSYNGIGNGFELKLTQVGADIKGEVTWMAGFTGANDYENSSWVSKKKSNFNDWNSSSATYSTCGSNLTLYFLDASQSRTVTFLDKTGAIIDTVVVPAGQLGATAPTPPTFPGFVFYAWDKDFSVVEEDMTVTALYHALYTVTFYDADGTTLSTQTVEETTAATPPDMTNHSYNGAPFSGWSADFSAVYGNMTVTAMYAAIPGQVLAAIAAGNIPAGALIWGGDDGDTWDASSYNWYTTGSLATSWRADAIAVFPTSGAVRVSGAKSIGGFVVALGADTALTGDTLSLASGAEAIFNSDGSLTISNDVSCADGMVQRVRDAHDVFVPGTTHDDEIDGNLTAESQLLFSGVSLSDVEYIQGTMTGVFGNASKTLTLSTASAATSDGGAFHFTNDGTTLTAQFQVKSYSTCRNCIKVQLVQVGADIYGQIAYEKSGYTNGGNPPPALGDNWDNYTGNGYSQSICDLKVGIPDKTIKDSLPTDVRVTIAGDFDGSLVVSNGVFEVADDATLSRGNFTKSIVTWNDGTILFGSLADQTLVTDIQTKGIGEVKLLEGSTLSLKEPSSDRSWHFTIAGDASATGYKTLPANSGSTTVLPGGSLSLNSFNSYWGPMGGAPLIVQTNGLLRLINQNSIGVSKPIYLEGGTLSNEVDKANILYKLYMNDGARVTGKGFQVGFKDYYNSWSFVNVGGSLPSLIDAESLMIGFQVPADSGKPIGVKFIVADVTGDADTDLLVASPITEKTGVTLFNEGYRDNLGVWKQGPGTLEIVAADNACSTGVFKIEAGTVKFARTAGGAFGAAVLLGDATLSADKGAHVSFADSSDQAWTADATLDIAKPLASRAIRFGTSANALTAAQLAQMTYDGKSGKLFLDAEGYLCGPGESTVILLR